MPEEPNEIPAPGSDVRVIETGFALDSCESVDLLLVQWHTPSPLDLANHVWRSAEHAEVEEKRIILQALAPILAARPSRPVFVVAPELSLPLTLISEIPKLLESSTKPIVFMTGLEHMTAAQYAELRQQFDESTSTVPLDATRRVNAAGVWIASGSGQVSSYLQVKRGLSELEQNDFCCGIESFLFASSDQRDGRRLNFAVAICADFTNKERVLVLRREMAKHMSVTAIDLMFLLQMNPKQEAIQFRTAVGAYFEPPVPLVSPGTTLISTDKSALVFVNQASVDADTTIFGRSAVHFHYNGTSVSRTEGGSTFAVEEHSGHDHHSAVFREDRASAYLVEYVPLHRRNPGVAGSNEPAIFRSAKHADLRQISAQEGVEFREIPAVVHWLLRRWQVDGEVIQSDALVNFRMTGSQERHDAVSAWCSRWEDAINWWRVKLGDDDNSARHRMILLLARLPSVEPRKWHAEESARLMLRSFVLLLLGKERTLAMSNVPCAHIELDGQLVSFLSGKNWWTWKTTADNFYSRHRTDVDALGRKPVLVIQEVAGALPWNEVHELPFDFTESAELSDDDITRAPRGKGLRCAATNLLYEALCDAETFSAACERIGARVDEVLT